MALALDFYVLVAYLTKNVFHGERIPGLHEITLVGLIAIICVFTNINWQEVKHRQRCSFFKYFFHSDLRILYLYLCGWLAFRLINETKLAHDTNLEFPFISTCRIYASVALCSWSRLKPLVPVISVRNNFLDYIFYSAREEFYHCSSIQASKHEIHFCLQIFPFTAIKIRNGRMFAIWWPFDFMSIVSIANS